MTRRRTALLVLVMLAATAANVAAAEPTVVVQPFELYNVTDLESLAPGLQSMLASRLEGEGYAVRTPAEEAVAEGEWKVNTTITRLGRVISVDASLVPEDPGQVGSRTYETVEGTDELYPALERVAERLKQSLAQQLEASAAPSAPAPHPPGPAESPPARTTSPPSPSSPANPSPSRETPTGSAEDISTLLSRHRTSEEIKGEANGLVVADIDADGINEVVMLLEERILGFRDTSGRITKIWESVLHGVEEPLALSAADRDGNGRVELFVAGQIGYRPVTQAYEWSGTALAPKGRRTDAFLRAVHHPREGSLLLGRESTVGEDLFRGPVRRYRWTEGGYRAGEAFEVPRTAAGLNLDYVQMQSEGPVYTAVTTQENDLQLYDDAGRRVFELEEAVKGTVNKLQGEEKTVGMMDEDIVYISGSTVSWVGPDGTAYLLVYKNTGGVGRLFKRLTTFSNSRILAYRWDGLSLAQVGESPTYSATIPDVALQTAGVGTAGATLYAALVRNEGLLNQESWSRVLAYDLP